MYHFVLACRRNLFLICKILKADNTFGMECIEDICLYQNICICTHKTISNYTIVINCLIHLFDKIQLLRFFCSIILCELAIFCTYIKCQQSKKVQPNLGIAWTHVRQCYVKIILLTIMSHCYNRNASV